MAAKEQRATAVLLLLTCTVLLTTPGVSATMHKVGGKYLWNNTRDVNYTEWANHERFIVGDWLYFVFDKFRFDVLEVNETAYDKCMPADPIANWTRGGRDVMELKEAKRYYFICSKGYCFGGMKVSVLVEMLPPPPASPPSDSPKSDAPSNSVHRNIFSLGIAWVSVLLFWFS